jgi:cell division protein FtsL
MTSQAIPLRARRAARRAATAGRSGPKLLPLAFFVLVVIAVFFLMIYLRIALDRTAFELETVERQIDQSESTQLDLRLDLARLQDPLRIATEARRMNMTYPDERLAVVVNGLDRVPAPPVVEEPVSALESQQP